MQINEITQRLPTFQAQLKVNGGTVTTRLQAINLTQARELLVHLYGSANVVALTLVSE
jgi:ribosomal protein S9